MVDMWNGVATPNSGKTTASYFLSKERKKQSRIYKEKELSVHKQFLI